jgi:hypothetical protein
MPPATKYYEDPNDRDARVLEDLALTERAERAKLIARNWDYYEGKHRKPLAADASGVDDNVILNKMRLIVNKAVSQLMGTSDKGVLLGPKFDVVDQDEQQAEKPLPRLMRAIGRAPKPKAQPTDNQKLLDAIWTANKKGIFLHDIGVSGSNAGHIYVKLIPDGATNPDTGAQDLPRFVNLNPQNVTVFWAADDVSKVLWYRYEYEYQEGSKYRRVREDTIRQVNEDGTDKGWWRILTYKSEGASSSSYGKWTLVSDNSWGYAWAPIHDWKNQPAPFVFYGQDDIRETGNVQDGLNFVASNVQRIIKYHASPTTIGTGFEADDVIQTDVNRLWTIAAADAKVTNLEMQSDLSSSMTYIRLLQTAIFDSAGQLDPSTVQDALGQLTNFGLRVLNQDSLQITGTKRQLYGEGLVELCQHALELKGVKAKVNDEWPDPLPSDPVSTAQALDMDTKHGLSEETYLERRGYDPEAEALNKERERGNAIMDQTIAQQGSVVEMMRNGQPTGQQQPVDQFGRPANGQQTGIPGNGLVR